MPSAAKKIVKREPEIDEAMYARLRSSGLAAVQIAGWLPAFLDGSAAADDLKRIALSIATCRDECKSLAADADNAGDRRLAGTAQKVLGLWSMLAEKADAALLPRA